jgi:hypothetical protein
MSRDVEIGRALAAIAAALNDQKVETFDADRVQDIVTESLGGQQLLKVDCGGGLHDQTGRRVGAIRRTPSGEWITERQNDAAERSDAAVPAEPQKTGIGGLVSKLQGDS